jgi:hypothetical protein
LQVAGKVQSKELGKQIDEVLPTLPPLLRQLVDAIREIGNCAAHVWTSPHTGEIVDVEPHEAELLLDILEGVFDFYFVQPAETKRKRDAINAKLAAAGRKPLKS